MLAGLGLGVLGIVSTAIGAVFARSASLPRRDLSAWLDSAMAEPTTAHHLGDLRESAALQSFDNGDVVRSPRRSTRRPDHPDGSTSRALDHGEILERSIRSARRDIRGDDATVSRAVAP